MPSPQSVALTVDANGNSIQQIPFKIKVVDSGTYTYVGYAPAGTATSAASWQVKRITNASGDVVWADSNLEFDNVWDNYASLSYG